MYDINIRKTNCKCCITFNPTRKLVSRRRKTLTDDDKTSNTIKNCHKLGNCQTANELRNNPGASCVSHLFPLLIDYYSHKYDAVEICQITTLCLKKSDYINSFVFYSIYYRCKYQYENESFYFKRLIDFQVLEKFVILYNKQKQSQNQQFSKLKIIII
eukprot:UN00270